ncbi:MAG: toxin-antitoxin system YwqK family antitoxin [Porphyromonas sp.]|nr:toxin-antitoxin system YwqK family antitoxin [Porphyromonas sp.]
MKSKLIFILVTAILYPILAGGLAYLLAALAPEGGADTPSSGMFRGFVQISLAIFFSVLLLVVSLLLSKRWFDSYLPALIAPLVLFLAFWLIGIVRDAIKSRGVPYVEYYESGVLKEEGRKATLYGGRLGKVKQYRPDGSLEAVETYREGAVDGACRYYHPNGQPWAEGDKIPVDKGTHWDCIEVGKWRYYRENGEQDDVRSYSREGVPQRSESYKLYRDSAGLIRRIGSDDPFSGEMDMEAVVESGVLFPRRYKGCVINGMLNGDIRIYCNTEKGFVPVFEGSFKDGERDGCVRQFYLNGQLEMVGYYRDGLLEGELVYYYQDPSDTLPHGRIDYICTYSKGKRNGTARWYEEDGTLTEETEFRNGKRHGISRIYNEDGSCEEYLYKDGERIEPDCSDAT